MGERSQQFVRAGRRRMGRPWVRRAAGTVVALLVVAALLGVTVRVASRVPAEVVLGAAMGTLEGRAEPSPGAEPEDPFAPLDAGFVAAVLGSDLSARLGLGPAPPGAGPADREGGPRSQGSPERTPGGTTTTTTPLLGPLASPVPQFSDLAASMEADPAVVSPGDHIEYRIAVTNVGTADFRGELRLESHHPFWTTDSSTPCGDTGIEPDPDEPCVAPPAPVPGTPDETIHTVQFSYEGPIARGERLVRQFRVRVDPGTPSGTEIRNHAHLDVVGDGAEPESSNTVTVRVR